MERASLQNPSHPPQEPYEGIPAQCLWAESAQPATLPWLPLLVAALVGAAIAFGMLFGGSGS